MRPPGPESTSFRPHDDVVSLSLPASRFVIALGAESRLVAVGAASARLPALSGLPVVEDLAAAAALSPDLVLLPEAPPPDDPTAERLRASGVALVSFAPHDLEDALELVRTLGVRLAGVAHALRFEERLSRSLAAIGGASFGRPRPRVLAVVGLDPLVVAGGHSFENDLIEIAGGRSITHGSEEPRLALTQDELRAMAPQLVLVVSVREPDAAMRRAALETLPSELPIAFFPFDRELFWLEDPTGPARRLYDRLAPISRALSDTMERGERGSSPAPEGP